MPLEILLILVLLIAATVWMMRRQGLSWKKTAIIIAAILAILFCWLNPLLVFVVVPGIILLITVFIKQPRILRLWVITTSAISWTLIIWAWITLSDPNIGQGLGLAMAISILSLAWCLMMIICTVKILLFRMRSHRPQPPASNP